MAIGLPSSTVQTPGTRSRSRLRLDILRYVKSPDDDEADSLANDGINEAIRALNMRLWGWAIQSQDIALIADTDSYSLKAEFKAPRNAAYLNSSDKPERLLQWEDPKTFQTRFRNRTGLGAPFHYTVINAHKDGLLYLSSTPDSGHVSSYPKIRVDYYKRIAFLVNDANELDAPSEVENFVTWEAKAYIASVMDPKMVLHAERKAASVWRALVRDDNESGHSDWSDSYV